MVASLGIPFPLAQLLAVRGYAKPEETNGFESPVKRFERSFLLPDMDRAVEVILQATGGAIRSWSMGLRCGWDHQQRLDGPMC
jgi:hypothetical protein